jgi:hypothetical protein
VAAEVDESDTDPAKVREARESGPLSSPVSAVLRRRGPRRTGLWKQTGDAHGLPNTTSEGPSESDWGAALERLADDALLWLEMRDPTEAEVAAVQEALELGDEQAHRLLEQPSRASLRCWPRSGSAISVFHRRDDRRPR